MIISGITCRQVLLLGQRLEASDDVEEFFRDRLLAPLVVVKRKLGQVALDVLLRGVHGSEATGILARQGLGERAVKRDEQMLPDQCRKQPTPVHRECGQRARGPAPRCQSFQPGAVDGEDLQLARPGACRGDRPVVNNEELIDSLPETQLLDLEQHVIHR